MEKYEKPEKEKSLFINAKRKHKKLQKKMSLKECKETTNGLPPNLQRRLRALFAQIEQEFQLVHNENILLQEKLEVLTEKYENLIHGQEKLDKVDVASDSPDGLPKEDVQSNKGTKKPSTSQLVSQKLRTTYRASTSRLVSSFKMPNGQGGSSYCQLIHKFVGHRDGIWEVTAGKGSIVGTASADRTARLWNIETNQCWLSYQGHSGSVNSIRFHPQETTVCTGAGDGDCHIWRIPPVFNNDTQRQSPGSESCGSGEEEHEGEIEPDVSHFVKIKFPLVQLTGHDGPVSSADWWSGGSQIVSASWDRTVKLWDVEKTSVIHTLEGHELEITHASTSAAKNLIVTSSQDTTFRLWDFRLPTIHSVNVFQGHTDTVTSAVFTSKADHVVSGSDDRTVKVWDLKNMRSPLATVRLDSPVNRLSISPTQNIIAIPHDNRHVRLYDLSGSRLSRLPRQQRQCHQRIVCSTCWIDDTNTKTIQLMTAGFDKQLLGWNVVL